MQEQLKTSKTVNISKSKNTLKYVNCFAEKEFNECRLKKQQQHDFEMFA